MTKNLVYKNIEAQIWKKKKQSYEHFQPNIAYCIYWGSMYIYFTSLLQANESIAVNEKNCDCIDVHFSFFYKNVIFFEGFMFLFSRPNEAFNILRAFVI